MHISVYTYTMKKGSRKLNIVKYLKGIHERFHLIYLTIFLIFVLFVGLFFVNVVSLNLGLEERDVDFGATFSRIYAEELGLDWKEVYLASLDELHVRRFRIPAYWTFLEPEPGEYDFSDLDWQIDEAGKRGAKVILAIGRKLPRWPECHIPDWAAGMPESAMQERVIHMLEVVVERYRSNPTIVVWQVENEPLFPFGECPAPDRSFLKREIAVVRALDSRPIMLTESGELSTWIRTAGLADILGISTYRAVWNRYIGHFYWPITPKNYARRGNAIKRFVDRIIVSELQTEPWSPGPIVMQPIDEQLELMNADLLEENLTFARRMGFPEVYVWGIEWWYWLKEQGHPELWEAGKDVFASLVTDGRGR